MKEYNVIGVMSGTSLDGVDLAHCTIRDDGNGYSFVIGACQTVPYPAVWLERLSSLPSESAFGLALCHTDYGRYQGSLVRNFIDANQLSPDFVASHGHTVFHRPELKLTLQLGDGSAMAAACGLPVVCDFRTLDVAHGGQGAPLVPVGDELLFGQYSHCLNIGGFANISMRRNGKRIAYDIAPANIVLNYLAGKAGQPFDRDGAIAASGTADPVLLDKLNRLPFYSKTPPKSLGREWVEQEILPLLAVYENDIPLLLSTFTEHIGLQVAAAVDAGPGDTMLVTGGGAFNSFLLARIKEHCKLKVVVPDRKTVEYKEALIFTLLGVLRWQNKPNCLSSVTGADCDVSGGSVYLP